MSTKCMSFALFTKAVTDDLARPLHKLHDGNLDLHFLDCPFSGVSAAYFSEVFLFALLLSNFSGLNWFDSLRISRNVFINDMH